MKIHEDIIKTKISNKQKKKRVFKVFKKDIFCEEFFSLQNIKIWRWQLFDIESYELGKNVKLKKPTIFKVTPCILQRRNHLEPLLKAAAARYKHPIRFER